MTYELDKPARQKLKQGNWENNQCWWLSLLEVVRASGKLGSPFNAGGRLHTYYTNGGKQEAKIPDEGEVPKGVTAENPMFKPLIRADKKAADWEILLKHLVYGPEWQRMIMFFLLDKTNNCPWHTPNDTVMTSNRATELNTLLGYLEITGITFDKPKTLLLDVEKKVNALNDRQRVIVDKEKHAMAAVVERVPPSDPNPKNLQPYNKIHIFNQATQNEFVCEVKTAKGKTQLISEKGTTVINWLLPVIIA